VEDKDGKTATPRVWAQPRSSWGKTAFPG